MFEKQQQRLLQFTMSQLVGFTTSSSYLTDQQSFLGSLGRTRTYREVKRCAVDQKTLGLFVID